MVIVALSQTRIESTGIHRGERRQASGCRVHGAPTRIEQLHAERGQHARAAIVGAGAAQADHELPQPAIEELGHQLADAARAALFDIDRGAVRIGEADDLRGFDDRDPALADDPVARFDSLP